MEAIVFSTIATIVSTVGLLGGLIFIGILFSKGGLTLITEILSK